MGPADLTLPAATTHLIAGAGLRWNTWAVRTDGDLASASSAVHPYMQLDAIDVYEAALARLEHGKRRVDVMTPRGQYLQWGPDALHQRGGVESGTRVLLVRGRVTPVEPRKLRAWLEQSSDTAPAPGSDGG